MPITEKKITDILIKHEDTLKAEFATIARDIILEIECEEILKEREEKFKRPDKHIEHEDIRIKMFSAIAMPAVNSMVDNFENQIEESNSKIAQVTGTDSQFVHEIGVMFRKLVLKEFNKRWSNL